MREVKALCTSLRKHSFLLPLAPRDVSRETSPAAKSKEKRMLSLAICVPSVSFSSQIQLVIILNCRVHLLDCEQSLFFFRFTEKSARARVRWATKPRDESRNEGGAFSHERGHFRVTCVSLDGLRKKRLLVVYASFESGLWWAVTARKVEKLNQTNSKIQ